MLLVLLVLVFFSSSGFGLFLESVCHIFFFFFLFCFVLFFVCFFSFLFCFLVLFFVCFCFCFCFFFFCLFFSLDRRQKIPINPIIRKKHKKTFLVFVRLGIPPGMSFDVLIGRQLFSIFDLFTPTFSSFLFFLSLSFPLCLSFPFFLLSPLPILRFFFNISTASSSPPQFFSHCFFYIFSSSSPSPSPSLSPSPSPSPSPSSFFLPSQY